jgi:hypothetical protein
MLWWYCLVLRAKEFGSKIKFSMLLELISLICITFLNVSFLSINTLQFKTMTSKITPSNCGTVKSCNKSDSDSTAYATIFTRHLHCWRTRSRRSAERAHVVCRRHSAPVSHRHFRKIRENYRGRPAKPLTTATKISFLTFCPATDLFTPHFDIRRYVL